MSRIKRAILVVLDGVGAGANPDAHAYGDDGASSLEHCAQAIGGLELPNLGSIGLGNITPILGTPPIERAKGAYGRMAEVGAGKDSTTGHWEITGVVLQKPLPTYPNGFPSDLVAAFEHAVGRVIARPFIGEPGSFKRTEHRRDFSLAPPGTTLLDLLKAGSKEVIGIGKIEDLFAGRGLTQRDHTETNKDGMAVTLRW